MASDRLPPQDIDTEKACLASALLSREALFQVMEILQPEDFYLERNRIIFDGIIELERKNKPVDLTTLKQVLVDKGRFDSIGGDTSLVELYQTVSTSANAKFYSNRLKELSLRRKLIELSGQAVEKCYDKSRDTIEIMDEIERDIFAVTEKRITSDYQSIELVLQQTMSNIETWYDTKKTVTGISSGFKDLDEILTGFHGSELIILAARPRMGKTAFGLNIINNIALKEKKAALFFSLEMPAHQLGMRMLCIEAMVDSQRVRTGHISAEELNKIVNASAKLSKASIYIDDTPAMNIFEIRAKARRLAQKEDLGIIVIDYLQLISSISKVERHLQIAEISRFLKQLARELDVPVFALSQLSRAVESRTDQIPTLSDLRESGSIEQDADVVLFIYREDIVKKDSERKGEADIIVAKQRNGPMGTISLYFWEKYTKFGPLSKEHISYEEAIPNYEID
jgi:replicative DNA helicase